jgi:two-component system, NarL family, invasion response regulator UvrY
MNPLLLQLHNAVETLAPHNFEDQKPRILEMVQALVPFHPNGDGDGRHKKLSPREREVMTMILSGRRLKEIAATLDISVKTVTTHRSRLLRKLGVDDNLGLYRYGIRNGLISV